MDEVNLLPGEVPGAILNNEKKISAHTKAQLARWLQCRGLKKTGSKKELVQRVQDCIDSGKSDIIDVAVDKGTWYQKKKQDLEQDGSTKAVKVEANIQKWGVLKKEDIPPLFNQGHIFHFIVERVDYMPLEEEDCNNNYNTSKPLRRAQYYLKSKFITSVEASKISGKFLARAKVHASMNDVIYRVFVSISCTSGAVLSGLCECKGSALGKCSHVAALLLYIDNIEGEELTCTSKPCLWNQGSKKKNPKRIQEATYSNSNLLTKASFDPRSRKRKLNDNKEFKRKKNLFFQRVELENIRNGYISMWSRLLSYYYDDFQLSEEESVILFKQMKSFLDALHFEVQSFPGDPYFIQGSEDQSRSEIWKRRRSIIFTASNCKTILGLTTMNAKKNFLRKNLWGLDQCKTEAMVYGLENEDNARNQYCALMENKFQNVVVANTGLWVSKEFPFLGCSADGIVSYEDENSKIQVGLLEIKCPLTLKDKDPNFFSQHLDKAQLSSFCLSFNNGRPYLKSTHAYYYQVQMSLAIHKLNWCDFVVWSSAGIIVLRIFRNESFWKISLPKLVTRYICLVPGEYFLQKTVRDLPPIEIDLNKFSKLLSR